MGVAAWLGFSTTPAARSVPWSSVPEVVVNLEGIDGATVETLWREQPNLRTVVSFLARNVAQLGLHTFERSADGNHSRARGGPVVDLLAEPNESDTTYELIYALVASLALYDEAFLVVVPTPDRKSGWSIRPLPVSWVVERRAAGPFGVSEYVVNVPDGVGRQVLKASDVLHFHGWDPVDTRRGASPVAALRDVLREQLDAVEYRRQRWRRGGRVDSYISRPANAPSWDPAVRAKWVEAYRAAYSGSGNRAGGTPLLEDGMELKKLGFSAREDEFVESAKLSLTTVASVYHINPVMVGVLDNANYSNVREFSRMLYSDTLGPLLRMVQDRLNAFLVPRVTDAPVFVEFNVKEKLRGSFEDEAASLAVATGRPWMTADEARATQNMAALGGSAGELVSNLNQTTDAAAAADGGSDDGKA